MTTSARLGLPFISVGQSQKEVTHNEALAIIDILLNRTALTLATSPPGSPADGDTHLVATSGTTGGFVGHEGEIAYYLTAAAAWQYITPTTGFEILVTGTSIRYRWTGSAWLALNGAYTPTLTSVTNVDTSTAYQCVYNCVGSVVVVSGKVRFNTNSAAAAQIDLSLPIASDLAAEEDLAGTCVSEDVADGPLWIKGDASNNRASIYSYTNGTANHDHFFTFQYIIK